MSGARCVCPQHLLSTTETSGACANTTKIMLFGAGGVHRSSLASWNAFVARAQMRY